MIATQREREAETQAEGEAGSMHREPDVGFDHGSPGSRPGPKAGAKTLRHPGIPRSRPFRSEGYLQARCGGTGRELNSQKLAWEADVCNPLVHGSWNLATL